jgi:hypothetical protein
MNLQIYERGGIKKGTNVEVEYLPNSGEGILIKREFIVKINRSFQKFILVCNVIFAPLGLLGLLAFSAFIQESRLDIENTICSMLTFICAVLLFTFLLYFRKI